MTDTTGQVRTKSKSILKYSCPCFSILLRGKWHDVTHKQEITIVSGAVEKELRNHDLSDLKY